MIDTQQKFTLTSLRILAIFGLAISFWLNGVFLIRWIASQMLWDSGVSIIIFILSVPIAYISITGIRKLLRLSSEQLSSAVILIVALVTMLHGITLTWLPNVYGASGTSLLFASAWLIWFCGTVLLTLFFEHTKSK